MLLSKLLKKIKKERKPQASDFFFTREQMMRKGSFYKFIKKECLDDENPLTYEDKVYVATDETILEVMAGLDADRTYLAKISFNNSDLPDDGYREDREGIYLVPGYYIDDAFPIEDDKFKVFLMEHIDLNDKYQVASVKTHLRRIGANDTLDFLEKML